MEDIKNGRLVCQEWKEAAQPIFERRARIYFHPAKLRPLTVLNAFNNNVPDHPFPSFAFSKIYDPNYELLPRNCWKEEELEMFFSKWGNHIRRLLIKPIMICKGKKHVNEYNLNTWIPNSCLKELIIIHDYYTIFCVD